MYNGVLKKPMIDPQNIMNNITKIRQILFGITLITSALLILALARLLRGPLSPVLPEMWKLAGLLAAGLLIVVALLWGIQGFVRLLSRWFPVAAGYELTYTLADQRAFVRQYRFVTLLYFILTPLIGYLAYQALAGLARLYYRLIPAEALAPADPIFWSIPAIFLGISLSGIPIWYYNKWRLKERFPRLLAFFNQQYRYDQRKAGLVFTASGLIISLALVLIGLNLYLRLTPEGVAENRFFGLVEEKHTYDQITRLEERLRIDPASPGQVLDHSFMIEFADGSRWQTGSFGRRAVPPDYRQALDYAAQHSGLPVVTLID